MKIVERNHLRKTRRWVVKIGSALLTNDGSGLDYDAISLWVKQMAGLISASKDPIEIAHMMIAHIDKKRKALGIDKVRERTRVDMSDRRDLVS